MKPLDAMLPAAVMGAITWSLRVLIWPAFPALVTTLMQIAQALQLQP
jgi:hypothetical protein